MMIIDYGKENQHHERNAFNHVLSSLNGLKAHSNNQQYVNIQLMVITSSPSNFKTTNNGLTCNVHKKLFCHQTTVISSITTLVIDSSKNPELLNRIQRVEE